MTSVCTFSHPSCLLIGDVWQNSTSLAFITALLFTAQSCQRDLDLRETFPFRKKQGINYVLFGVRLNMTGTSWRGTKRRVKVSELHLPVQLHLSSLPWDLKWLLHQTVLTFIKKVERAPVPDTAEESSFQPFPLTKDKYFISIFVNDRIHAFNGNKT